MGLLPLQGKRVRLTVVDIIGTYLKMSHPIALLQRIFSFLANVQFTFYLTARTYMRTKTSFHLLGWETEHLMMRWTCRL